MAAIAVVASRPRRRRVAAAIFHIHGMLSVATTLFHVRIASAAAVVGATPFEVEVAGSHPAAARDRIASPEAAAAAASGPGGVEAAQVVAGDGRRPLMRASPQPAALAQVGDSTGSAVGMSTALEAEIVSMLHKQQAELDMLTAELREKRELDSWKAEHVLSRHRRHVPIAEQLAREMGSPSLVIPPDRGAVHGTVAASLASSPAKAPEAVQLTEAERSVLADVDPASEFSADELKVLQEAGLGVVAKPPQQKDATKQHEPQNVKAWVESHATHRASSRVQPVASKASRRKLAGGLLDDRQVGEAAGASVAAGNSRASPDTIGGVPVEDPSKPAASEATAPQTSYRVNVVTKVCMAFGIFAAVLLTATGALIYQYQGKEAFTKAEKDKDAANEQDEDEGAMPAFGSKEAEEKYLKMKADMKSLKEQHEKLKQEQADVTALKETRSGETNAATKAVFGDSILLHDRDSREERMRRHYLEMCGLALVFVLFCGIVVVMVNAIAAPQNSVVAVETMPTQAGPGSAAAAAVT
eukprot:TRINITY_DN32803_c0_g3_i1.p1 TRINITY_DN32803_c0_g3~~TRINITY_DN32803_c0_g3_i1.p1  ORF type:complete len:528 (+),score=140.11 TRINITY_DN32803_c0_g3_i1:130-1713(+)